MIKVKISGFTLIELVIAMGIIAILAGLVIVAVNPFEQLARARDASRIAAITELSKSLEAYRVNHNSNMPPTGSSWITTLVSASEANGSPANPNYASGTSCASSLSEGGYCFNSGTGDTVIYARLESHMDSGACGVKLPFWVYSTGRGQGGGVCVTSGQEPSVTGLTSFDF